MIVIVCLIISEGYIMGLNLVNFIQLVLLAISVPLCRILFLNGPITVKGRLVRASVAWKFISAGISHIE